MSDVGNTFDTLAQDHLETNDGEVVHNQSSYSFDDVEKLTDSKPEAKSKEEPKEEKEPVKTKDDSQQTLEADEDSGIEEKIEENNRESKEEKAKEELPEDIKKLTAKFGDSDLEIPADALIPHKVDGEETQVPLQELLNNYSGKVAWDKRFQELDTERKAYKSEKELVERYVTDFAKLAEGDDKMAAMEYLAQFAGIDPIQFRRQLRQQVLDKYGNYEQMSEVERKALDQEEELAYHKRQLESEKANKAEQQSRAELESQILSIQKTHDISDDDLMAAYKELEEHVENESEVTPELLDRYIVNKNAWFSAKDIVNEVSPSLLEQDGFVDDVAAMMLENPDLEPADVREVIENFTKKQKQPQQKASEKIREQESAKNRAKPKAEYENYFSFEDLEE